MTQDESTNDKAHIRPTRRRQKLSPAAAAAAAATPPASEDDKTSLTNGETSSTTLTSTDTVIKSWYTKNDGDTTDEKSTSSSTNKSRSPSTTKTSSQQQQQQKKKPTTSILRQPKYSSNNNNNQTRTSTSSSSSKPATRSNNGPSPHTLIRTTTTDHAGIITTTDDDDEYTGHQLPPAVVEDVVIERPSRRQQRNNKRNNKKKKATTKTTTSSAVEGYIPNIQTAVTNTRSVAFELSDPSIAAEATTDPSSSTLLRATASGNDEKQPDDDDDEAKKEDDNNNDNNADNDEPLVFNSLADMMEMAGTLPDQNDDKPSVIEAELQFSCMDPNEYETSRQVEREEQQRVFLGHVDLFGDDDDDDGVWDILEDDDDDDDEQEPEEPPDPPRAFFQLWTALSQWMTPHAVQYLHDLEHDNDQQHDGLDVVPYDRSDIGVSRCAGLWAMLQMHISKCWTAIIDTENQQQHPPPDLRATEMKLVGFLRCLDYSRPSPKCLDTAHTRALTCILLHTIFIQTTTTAKGTDNDTAAFVVVPEPCRAVGMNADEYRYLTRTAIRHFGHVVEGEQDTLDDPSDR